MSHFIDAYIHGNSLSHNFTFFSVNDFHAAVHGILLSYSTGHNDLLLVKMNELDGFDSSSEGSKLVLGRY